MTDHDEIEMLLPWYVTGKLDVDEVARVDAHLTRCAECRQMRADEHALKAEVAAMPVAVPAFSMTPPVVPARPSIASRGWVRAQQTVASWKAKPLRIAAFAAAQAAVVLVTFQLAQPAPEAEFRTLSSGDAVQGANAVVMFRPETREAQLRAILAKADAKIVDGPTEAGTYMLAVPETKRDTVIAALQKDPAITLAQPIDEE